MDIDDDNEDIVEVSGEPLPRNIESEKVKSDHTQYDGYINT